MEESARCKPLACHVHAYCVGTRGGGDKGASRVLVRRRQRGKNITNCTHFPLSLIHILRGGGEESLIPIRRFLKVIQYEKNEDGIQWAKVLHPDIVTDKKKTHTPNWTHPTRAHKLSIPIINWPHSNNTKPLESVGKWHACCMCLGLFSSLFLQTGVTQPKSEE